MILRVGLLPDEPLAAAAKFHSDVLPSVRDELGNGVDLVLIFDPADYQHRDWRQGVIRGLAREYAPCRVNAISGNDASSIAAAIEYLKNAAGVTGQIIPVVGQGAGTMLYQD